MRDFLKRLYFAWDYLSFPRDFAYCVLKRVRWSPSWRFYGLPFIRVGGRGSRIVIGKRFVANSKLSRNSFGIIQRVVVRTVGHGSEIRIGDNVGISGCTVSAAKSIRIGNNVLVGSGAIISDSDAHPIDPRDRLRGGGGECSPVVIEDDVFIGARAIILKGVTIGRGSVIGAGSVVAKSIQPYSIAVGNPVRVVGDSRRGR